MMIIAKNEDIHEEYLYTTSKNDISIIYFDSDYQSIKGN